jgi:hypothetical protein
LRFAQFSSSGAVELQQLVLLMLEQRPVNSVVGAGMVWRLRMAMVASPIWVDGFSCFPGTGWIREA